MATVFSIHPLIEPIILRFVYDEKVSTKDLSSSLKPVIEERMQQLPQQSEVSSLLARLTSTGMELLNTELRDHQQARFKTAGITLLDCIIGFNDESNASRRVDVSNSVRKIVFENEKLNLEITEPVVRAAAKLVGHYARISSSTENEFLQKTYLDLFFRLIVSVRADHLRFCGAVLLVQLSENSPSLVFARRKDVLAKLWDCVCDRNSTVRLAGADALEEVLQLVSQREDISEHLNQVIRIIVNGLQQTSSSERIIGSLLILSIVISGKIIRLDTFKEAIQKCGMHNEDIIWQVLQLATKKLELETKNLIIDLVPKLATAFSKVFVSPNQYIQNTTFLQFAGRHLLTVIRSRKDAGPAYLALGKLFISCVPLRTSSLVEEIFRSVIDGFGDAFNAQALECLGMVVNFSPPSRRLVDKSVIDAMFRGGLTAELIEALKIVIKHVPQVLKHLQTVLRIQISEILMRYAVVLDDTSVPSGTRASGARPVPPRPLAAAGGTATGTPAAATHKTSGTSRGGFFGGGFFSSSTPEPVVEQVTTNTVNSTIQLKLAMEMLSSAEFFTLDSDLSDPRQFAQRGSNNGSGSESASEFTESLASQLLQVAKDGVVRYLDDGNDEIRCTAALTCLALFDHILPSIDRRGPDMAVMSGILERLLLMSVGDDSVVVRAKVLSSFPLSLDSMVANSNYVNCLSESLNDESLSVRVAAMSVISRAAHFDLLRIMPVIRLNLMALLKQLNYSRFQLRRESVQLLEAMVRGARNLIVPYVNQILEPLISMLDDKSSDVVGVVLSTIGELALASPEIVLEYIDRLFPRLIEALDPHSSLATRETAVIAMGKLVTSLALLTNKPYEKFPSLFNVLVQAVQCEDENGQELRLQAIRTMGLLGAVEPSMHQARLRKDVGVVDAFTQHDYADDAADLESSSGSDADFGPKAGGAASTLTVDYRGAVVEERVLTKAEKFNFAFVLRELVRIILDSSLSIHHQIALQTALKAVRHVGAKSFPFIDDLIRAMVVRFKYPDTVASIRDLIIDSLSTLVYVIGRPMRKYQAVCVELITHNMAQHLQPSLDLVEACFCVFSSGSFQSLLMEIIPTMISLCRDEALETRRIATDVAMQSYGNRTLGSAAPKKFLLPIGTKVMQTVANIKPKLGQFRRQMVHLVLTVIDNQEVSPDIRKFALCVSMHLADDAELIEYANRIVHPVLRLISLCTTQDTQSLLQAAITSLSVMLCRIGVDFLQFIVPIRRCVRSHPKDISKMPQVEEYESLVRKLLRRRPLPMSPNDAADIAVVETLEGKALRSIPEPPFQMSYQALETAWALANRDSQSDLVDWIERLSIELIRQSPSTVIRMCAPITKSYRPMAEKLFNVSFGCIWDELYAGETVDVIDEIPVINSIEMALNSSQIPVYIVNVLLSLVEFMGMQDKRLPIDVPLLGRQAEIANMFSKSLYYRELEFESKNVPPNGECVEALITVANELGLEDRARGVLAYVTQYLPNIEVKPLWLEKLQQWRRAHQLYSDQNRLLRECYPHDKPTRHPVWMASELGVLRCLYALGEFETLQKSASELRDYLKTTDMSDSMQLGWMSEVQNLGANASWMLGQWGTLSQFVEGDSTAATVSTNDVELNNNLTFYRAVLAIHDNKLDLAMSLVADSREQILRAISALMSENYSRAYRAMVSMQILAEMEEVVEYKASIQRANAELASSAPISRPRLSSVQRGSSVTSMTDLWHNNFDNSQFSSSSSSGNGITLNEIVSESRTALVRKWNSRLKSAPKEVDMYRQILAIHTLAVEPREDLAGWLELVSLCRQESRYTLCGNVLAQLGAPQMPNDTDLSWADTVVDIQEMLSCQMTTSTMQVMFATFNYWWMRGDRAIAAEALSLFLDKFPRDSRAVGTVDGFLHTVGSSTFSSSNSQVPGNKHAQFDLVAFRVSCLLKKAEWTKELGNKPFAEVLKTVREARELASDDYNVWHAWAVANYTQLQNVDTKTPTPGTPDMGHAISQTPFLSTTPKKPSGTAEVMKSMLSQMADVKSKKVVSLSETVVVPTPSEAKRLLRGPYSKSAGARSPAAPKSVGLRRSSVSLANLMTYRQETDTVSAFVVEAIKGFVRSIVLGKHQPVAIVLQDTLRLLTLWFTYGTKLQVFQTLSAELEQVSAEHWLMVIPQLIARMHVKSNEIAGLLQRLLVRLAATHPQALVCPIYVALNTQDMQQKQMATDVVLEMRKHRSQLVDEATLVSKELMRVAMTPHENWHDGLELAAQQYMEMKDTNAMLQTLLGLHNTLNTDNCAIGPDMSAPEGFSEDAGIISEYTLRDISFRHSYGRQLADAQYWIYKYRDSGRTTHLHQAWEIYQVIFKKIKAQIGFLKKVELHHVSPALTGAVGLSLAVPGTYSPFKATVSIARFSPTVTVIASKQRPRKMSIIGSDGIDYQFLLKGKEDLRQDERVMQLFGLINVCIDNSLSTRNRGMEIVRYSVLPLSNNSGVIGWVDNCDTLNSLIKQYRELKQIRLTTETKLLASKCSNYNKLTLMQKVDTFQQVLDETTGQDLAKMMWLKSKTADAWVERRAYFSRSLAVMSMVGYILGLGDRHPSNLMVDRISGRIVHIDFGDCFEVTSKRAKFPEIIPFRLTRMLQTAVGKSGIEGTYRATCERIMTVLRDNKDSVMAMLEAFVYDPLISWRLLGPGKDEVQEDIWDETVKSPINKALERAREEAVEIDSDDDDHEKNDSDEKEAGDLGVLSPSAGGEGLARRDSFEAPEDGVINENINARALEVITRIQAKLTGRDFAKYDFDPDLSVQQQVDRLIKEATNVENLCQLYQGWCPLW